jgi:predicted metal-dependent peptidase
MSNPKLLKARARLMKGNIGMATMILNLDLVEDNSFGTLATDGQNIFYNSGFVDSISEKELQGVLVHEACHVIWEHPLRKGHRHHVIWNYATDYAINLYLSDLGYKLPEGGLLDYKYRDMTAEKIYQILVDDEESLQEAVDDISGDDSVDVNDTDLDDLPLPTGTF